MRVRCISIYPNDEQLAQLGENFSRRNDFGLEIGKEYLALGLDFHVNDNTRGTGVYVEYLLQLAEGPVGLILSAPICLFEIVDDRPSKYWRVCKESIETVSLKPPSFYKQYYYDDFSEFIPEVVEDFAQVYALLESEYDCSS